MTQRSQHCPELPASPGRIILFSTVSLLTGFALALWAERPRGPQCTGILSARTAHVIADGEGQLSQFLVREGQTIALGDPLAKFTDEQLDQNILAIRKELVTLETELQRLLATAELELNWRTRALEAELCEIQLRCATYLRQKYDSDLQRNMLHDMLAGRELTALNDPHTLFQTLVLDRAPMPADRLGTMLQLESAVNAADVSTAQMEICQMRQRRLEQLLVDLPGQVRSKTGVDLAEARLERTRGDLDRLLAQREELVIRSPGYGRVGVFKVHSRQPLEAGTPIVEILDDSQRYLSVAVPSQEITSFPTGTEVQLTFPGRTERTGRVTSVAPQARAKDSDGPVADSTIEVQVEQTGQLWPDVPIGSYVRVRLHR